MTKSRAIKTEKLINLFNINRIKGGLMFDTITKQAPNVVCLGAGAIGYAALFGIGSILTFGYGAMALGGTVIALNLLYLIFKVATVWANEKKKEYDLGKERDQRKTA